jgi:hypothetical protein
MYALAAGCQGWAFGRGRCQILDFTHFRLQIIADFDSRNSKPKARNARLETQFYCQSFLKNPSFSSSFT